MIPTYLMTAGFQEPEDPIYYLVGANGCFLRRKTQLFTSVTAVSGVAGLEAVQPRLTWTFGKLRRELLESVYGFFDWAYREWESEAIVYLYYDPEKRSVLAHAPPQTVFRYRSGGRWYTEGRVEYEAVQRPGHLLKLGDIHSHGDLPAFFSSKDDEDDHEDGLRIVMGGLHRSRPDVRASFIASGVRFMLDSRSVMEEFDTPMPPPEAWIKSVSCEVDDRYRRTPYGNGKGRP